PNVLLVHFNNLKADLPGQMRRIASFLGIEIDESRFPAMIEHCGIDYMRRTSAESPILDMVFKNGGTTFFNKGTNGRWKDLLTAADLRKYDEVVQDSLTPDCARVRIYKSTRRVCRPASRRTARAGWRRASFPRKATAARAPLASAVLGPP